MTDQPIDERAGLLSASSGERVYRCLGSLKAAQEAKERGEAPPAEAIATQGDRIHEALEGAESDEEEEPTFEDLPEKEAEIAGNLSRIGLECLGDWRIERGIDAPDVTREERLWIRDDNLNPIASAKPDLIARSGSEGFVLDYKSGFKPITNAQSNIQLRLQALALWHESGGEIAQVRVAAAQYRLFGQKIYADYTTQDLELADKELKFVLWRANQDNAPRVPGEWCEYCPARGTCREAAAYALLPVPGLAFPMKFDSKVMTKDDVMELIPRLTPEELLYIWRRSGLVYKILKATRSRLAQMPDEVLDKLGIYKRTSAPAREIFDVLAAWETLKDVLTPSEFIETCKPSILKLEEIYGKKTRKQAGSIKQAKENFTRILKAAEAMRMKPRGYRMHEKEVEPKQLESST